MMAHALAVYCILLKIDHFTVQLWTYTLAFE